MKHAKSYASSQLSGGNKKPSEGNRKLFELVEEYKKNGGDFGDEAILGFRQALAERLKNPPEPTPAETAEIMEYYRAGVLRLLEDINKPKRPLKKKQPFLPIFFIFFFAGMCYRHFR